MVEPAQGRALEVFGRLADRVPPGASEAEVAAFGLRMASEFPESNINLRAEVVPFGVSQMGLPRGGWKAAPDYYLT